MNQNNFSQKAYELALTHHLRPGKPQSRRIRRDLQADILQLQHFAGEIRDSQSSCSQPAEEWLLDHAEFLDEQALDLAERLEESSFSSLPVLRDTGEPRILSICDHYLKQTNGHLDETSLVSFINRYQEVSVLTIAECWTVPTALRLALMRRLKEAQAAIQERRDICTKVERLLESVETNSGGLNGESVQRLSVEERAARLRAALDDAGESFPMSGATVVHLISHLRERTEDTAAVRDWAVCQLDHDMDSLDRIITHEYRLQSDIQMMIANMIGSLRLLSRLQWRDYFVALCRVENTLRTEATGDYERLDATSKETLRSQVARLARRLRVPENLVAEHAVKLADDEVRKGRALSEDADPDTGRSPTREQAGNRARSAFVAYYLLDPTGMYKLFKSLKTCSRPRSLPGNPLRRRATGSYVNLIVLTFSIAIVLFALWVGQDAGLHSPWQWIPVLIALAVPALEWSVTVSHWLIECCSRPRPLLRYDLSSGIPDEAAAMVVIPVIWSSEQEVTAMFDRLELHYLANRDRNLRFALLGDYRDAQAESLPEDDEVARSALDAVARLNRKYPGTPFYYLQRRRQWNESERVWMGWERKRGKLVELVEWIQGKESTSYSIVSGDQSCLSGIRYVITLDADTQLPVGSAHRMIGTMHLPYNRPCLNETKSRVIAGYGVLQPRIGISHEASLKTRLAFLWSHEPGVDPYAFAVSDPYQDGFDEGIFTGKGIFDVETFAAVLCDRIPDNRVLSHDLLEGGFLRAGLLSDIELIDDHPATFYAHQQRQHRWVRGDWQLLLWLRSRLRNRQGEIVPIDLSFLTRWQIVDNLRRSLFAPVMFVLVVLALTVLPGSTIRWLGLLAVTGLLPVWRQLATARPTRGKGRGLAVTLAQCGLGLMTLPYQAVTYADAIIRTLYRLTVSRRRLLEWVSSAEVERKAGQKGAPALYGLAGGFACILAMLALAWVFGTPFARVMATLLAVLWSIAPMVVRWLEQPVAVQEQPLTEHEQGEMLRLAKQIWSFYEDYVTKEDNWLPPDNVQFDPPNGIAHRTSPTNIGLYLACVLAARDFGFIDTDELVDRTERTVETMERMKKWEGHLYNWYDTVTLQPLPPMYVSTVDSGNLVVCLMAVKEGLAEWLGVSTDEIMPLRRRQASVGAMDVAFAEELAPSRLDGTEPRRRQDGSIRSKRRERGIHLLRRLESLIQQTDFRPLFDRNSNLLSLGYHTRTKQRDTILYDLLASEARQASFAAIALGQLPVTHWNTLGRTMTMVDKPALLSWSGTMFEYLMPWLFMRTYRHSVWDKTYRNIVQRQIEYADEKQIPFGISESGYYDFDYQMNYQYRAFGVPGLGYKRGLEQDVVVSPYATILALPYARSETVRHLDKLEKIGARGRYGYYEAVDFTPRRLPGNSTHRVIRSYMAHHQGMSMLTLSNVMLERTMYDRFHRDKRVRAAELLLQERMPLRPKVVRHHALRSDRRTSDKVKPVSGRREFSLPGLAQPEVCLLSNGTMKTFVTANGSGYSRWNEVDVTRWREDAVLESWGSAIYIHDMAEGKIWSPAPFPCYEPAEDQRAVFTFDKAMFIRKDELSETVLEIAIAPERDAELRQLTIRNTASDDRIFEVTAFSELALAPQLADAAHPAFSKLFVSTEYDEDADCLVAWRRPRSGEDKPIWAACALLADAMGGALEFETDRAAFIGRGYTLSDPKGLHTRLQGSLGSVADPAFVLRRRVRVAAGASVKICVVTAVAETKAQAVDMIDHFRHEHHVEHAMQYAWNRSQIDLRHMQLDASDAMLWQTLAARLLYPAPPSRAKKQNIINNSKGQPDLWAYGVSGDRPLAIVHIDDQVHLPAIVRLIRGHEYLRRQGLPFDLLILNETEEGDQQELQEALLRAVEHGVDRVGADGASGVSVVREQDLPTADRTLLLSVSRVELRAGGPSLHSQLRLAGVDERYPPPFRAVGASVQDDVGEEELYDVSEWTFFNGWGGFSPDGSAYRMIIKDDQPLPAPWVNVMANPQFGSIVSERGGGYTWWKNSREFKLTPWSNDPVLDPPGEMIYVRDEESGDVWHTTPTAKRNTAEESVPPYRIEYGYGYSSFHHVRHGIEHDMTIYVPQDDPVKITRLRLRNRGGSTRYISISSYVEWVLGVDRSDNTRSIVSEWDSSNAMLLARNAYQERFRGEHAFLTMFTELSSGGHVSDQAGNFGPELSWTADQENKFGPELSWTADRVEFIGRGGTREMPAALGRTNLSGRTGVFADSCGAIQMKLELPPQSEVTVYILLGCEQSRQRTIELADRFRRSDTCEQALHDIRLFWQQTLETITVQTPCEDTNLLLNGWLLYQSLACRMWARTAFYQAGGAFGYRDQLQDSLSLLHIFPERTRAQIMLHAAHQYVEGDVQHWWHEETDKGIRTRFSDDLLWLPYATARYIEHTGDESVLQERVPYLYSEPLQDGEMERYEDTVQSDEIGTVYEHCMRAIERSLSRMGEHGLPLIGIGDWNDGMSQVGDEGRGESVWLGWFLCDVLRRFEPICRRLHEQGQAERFRAERERLASALNEHGWDGHWYRRAFNDAGRWLGSVQEAECRIDAIAQSWSVISGAGDETKTTVAMNSFDRELVDRELSLVRLLTPPFDQSDPSPGYIQGYPPGIRENGAQYTHGVIWGIVAWSMLGNGNKAHELFQMLNPINHTRTPHEVRQYKGEPYVIAADVYTAAPHEGRAGWTWYTGSAGWLYQAGIEWILGLHRKGDRLYVNPRIPSDWKQLSIRYRYGHSVYRIEVSNPDGRMSGVTAVSGSYGEGTGESSRGNKQDARIDSDDCDSASLTYDGNEVTCSKAVDGADAGCTGPVSEDNVASDANAHVSSKGGVIASDSSHISGISNTDGSSASFGMGLETDVSNDAMEFACVEDNQACLLLIDDGRERYIKVTM